ncbi:hypothetical protein JHD50_10400 [Sulfurimonas sp. MAG313]|nr:hypothetical protein [Sulfurimonas sp. MAG313]MDF1881703.1 hypothetical protein [Sulfurimonas sp. MAG313]
MYTVTMLNECSCFKKSDFDSEKEFQFQREAYKYANTVVELMNEDFCSTHLFTANITTDDNFVIGVELNPNAGTCATDSNNSGCGTSCGC